MSFDSNREEELINKSGDPQLCRTVLANTRNLLKEENIEMTEPQWLSLVSHISAMVYRSVNMEHIQPLDRSIFNEVSDRSIELASKICTMLDNLHEDEKYLLSIHFEAAN